MHAGCRVWRRGAPRRALGRTTINWTLHVATAPSTIDRVSASTAAVDVLVADLKRIFAERLISVVIYGPHADGDGGDHGIASLALTTSVGVTDLDACAGRFHAWRRLGLETPLVLAQAEFMRSLDAF